MIFLSYASEDYPRAAEIYDGLTANGLDVWLDKKRILAGQDWEHQIWRAATRADFFCILLSSNSVNKRGFVRKEIRFALEKWKEKLPDDVYLVPCRLEAVEPPFELKHLQYLDLFNSSDVSELARLLAEPNRQAEENDQSSPAEYEYRTEVLKPGLSNVDFEFQYPVFGAPDLESLSAQAKRFAYEVLDEWKDIETPDEVSIKSFVEAGFNVHLPTSHIVSLQFAVHWYGAGAAHPNMYFRTFCFDRRTGQVIQLKDLFANPESALRLISDVCRLDLRKQLVLDGLSNDDVLSEESHIDQGARVDWSCFTNFVVTKIQLNLLFNPYQVGPYAWGPRFVEIEFVRLRDVLSDRIVELVRE